MHDFSRQMASLQKTAYHRWIKTEGIPMVEALGLSDVRDVPVYPWRRTGGKGSFIHMYGSEGITGMYVGEIPPGGALEPEKHMYEEVIFILEGSGATEVWQENGPKHLFEWGKWSLFAPPLNSWHRLVNGAREPVKFLAVTDAPLVMDLYRNAEFVFNNPFAFTDRYDGQREYFAVGNNRYRVGVTNVWDTNFIPDVGAATIEEWQQKGEGVMLTQFESSGNCLIGHISEWPVGCYHKAHYHGAGAILVGLRSTGYVLLWPKELGPKPYENGHADQVVQIDWKEGGIYCPPGGWYHQHFNTGPEPARHLAIRFGGRVYPTGFHTCAKKHDDAVLLPLKEGGTMIDSDEEDPAIRRHFELTLKKAGIAPAPQPAGSGA
ncbi:MAG TPA: cupin domain-containing protein [Candidatus Binatia bacterium]|jgi:oxalate decarboxylase/phosphoglucose isomerase-like protein (cupin superfamily)